MRVVLTLLVRDSADIVATNIDYYLVMGIDHVIVTDNPRRRKLSDYS